jgi:hypothetical protein
VHACADGKLVSAQESWCGSEVRVSDLSRCRTRPRIPLAVAHAVVRDTLHVVSNPQLRLHVCVSEALYHVCSVRDPKEERTHRVVGMPARGIPHVAQAIAPSATRPADRKVLRLRQDVAGAASTTQVRVLDRKLPPGTTPPVSAAAHRVAERCVRLIISIYMQLYIKGKSFARAHRKHEWV